MSLQANFDEITPAAPFDATAAWITRTQVTFGMVSLAAYVPVGTTMVRMAFGYGGGGVNGDDVRMREVGDVTDTEAHRVHAAAIGKSQVETTEILMRLDSSRRFEARHAKPSPGGGINALAIKGYWLGETPP